MINTTNIQQAKNEINRAARIGAGGRGAGKVCDQRNKSCCAPIIVQSQTLEFNRKILEYGKFQILLDVHNTKGKDKLRKLDSGLNHIMAKIAAKKRVAIGVDLERLRSLRGKEKAQTLARIVKNVEVCRKAKCRLVLVNWKDEKDAFEFLISLGASTEQAREATKNQKGMSSSAK
jgi:RNase P/RNase MRP subunit p30